MKAYSGYLQVEPKLAKASRAMALSGSRAASTPVPCVMWNPIAAVGGSARAGATEGIGMKSHKSVFLIKLELKVGSAVPGALRLVEAAALL